MNNKTPIVGVLTFHFADNYGAVLQAYGTIKHLSDNGYKCKIINYQPQNMLNNYDINPFNKCGIEMIKYALKYNYKKKQVILFNDFRKKFLKQGKEVYNNVYDAYKGTDVIIVGSDQVWNIELTEKDISYFLPKEEEKLKKIGYAISMGKYDNSLLIDCIKKYADSFSALSFREERAVQICRNHSESNACVVMDPVFLLEQEKWEKIECKPRKFRYEKYILYYVLEDNDVLFQSVKKYADKHKLPIISIHPTSHRCNKSKVINLNNVGPREFIWLINHATFVGTNSFHGMAFALIFKKTIIFAAHKSLGDRNRHLLSLLGIEDGKEGNCYDFNLVDDRKVKALIEDSKDFLTTVL